MGSPAFNPNASYDIPSFDPKGDFQAAGAPPSNSSSSPGILDKIQSGYDALQQKLLSYKGSPLADAATGALAAGLHPHAIAGALDTLAPFMHPEQAAQQLASHPSALLTPVMAGNMAQQAAQDPERVVGQLAATAGEGEATGAVAKPIASALGRATGRAVLLGKTPEGAYESALKPSTAVSPADRAAAVQTGLQNSIPVSKAGLEKLGDLVDDLDAKKAAVIASSPGRTIDPYAVAQRTDATAQQFGNQVVAQPDLQAIQATKDQFLAERGQTPTTPAQPIPADQAQAMKSGTYQVLRGKYGEQGSAVVEAQKALARGLKEEIATQFPEIGNLNAAESKLLNLEPLLERAVARTGNHQAIGIGTPVAAAAGKALTGSTGAGAVIGALKGVLDNPLVKSRLAIAVSKGGNIAYPVAAAKVAAYASSLQSALDASQQSSTADTPNQ